MTNKKTLGLGSNLRISMANVNGIKNKFDIISAEFPNEADIFGLVETKLSPQDKMNKHILGFHNPVEYNRPVGKGGGILIYIKDAIPFQVLKISTEIESIWIRVRCRDNPLNICFSYKPPFCLYDYWTLLQQELDEIVHKYDGEIAMLGDFNSDTWNITDNLLVEFCKENSFFYTISEPTRVRSRLFKGRTMPVQTATILDQVLVSTMNIIEKVNVGTPVGNSDHCRITLTVRRKFRNKKCFFRYHDYSETNFELLSSKISELDLIKNSKDINEQYSTWLSEVNEVIENNRKTKLVHTSSNHREWYDDLFLKAKRLKDKSWRKYKKDRSFTNFVKMKTSADAYKKQVNDAKASFQEKQVALIENKKLSSDKQWWSTGLMVV